MLERNSIKTWMLTGESYTKAIPYAYLYKIIKSDKIYENIYFESLDYDEIKHVIKKNLEKLKTKLIGEENNKNSAFLNIKT